MGFGMFAFTALGDRYFAYGALAGLYAATTAGLGKADASASSRLSLLLTQSGQGGLHVRLLAACAIGRQRTQPSVFMIAAPRSLTRKSINCRACGSASCANTTFTSRQILR